MCTNDEPIEITPFQKMLSATTGSLLTGLTSMGHAPFCQNPITDFT